MFYVTFTVVLLSIEGIHHKDVAHSLEAFGNTVRFSHIRTVQHHDRKTSWGTPVTYESTLPPLLDSSGLSLAVRRLESVTIRSKDVARLDRSLSMLTSIPRLKHLSFYDTPLTTEKLNDVLSNTEVSSLYLRNAKLPRGRIPCLNHPTLKWLCVCHTQFSNPALADLTPTLTYLDLTRTRINDKGLPQLQRLRDLKQLNLRRTPTTVQAVDQLRDAMPWCRISWEALRQP